ncbi:MAG: ABC transporter ATP-binding protein [Clostridium sp.]|nr:ABC transporter ATP-binding protein [Clostridium sp.]
MDNKNKIVVKNITKKFGDEVVLDHVSLDIERGKITGFVGRNGSGKTLLMKCICGFIHPTDGSVEIDNKIVGKDIDIPDGLGVIIETPGFINNYSGIKNLKLLASVRGKIKVDSIITAMEQVGLDSKSRKHVGKYSLGMRQKLGIAQAIMEKPDVLILDEPMNGLDNKSVETVRGILKDLVEEGTTIILASHNREDIEVLCNKVFYMDNGKLVSCEEQSS